MSINIKDSNNLYPVSLEIIEPINGGLANSYLFANKLIESAAAVNIKVYINSNEYMKEDVLEALNQAYQKVLECFH